MSTRKAANPADKIERRKVADLIPYANNARTHDEDQIAELAGSIREFGWTVPVVIDEADNIIAGHGRILAARKLKMTTIPCVVARGWSEPKRKAYILADNKLALNADWDNDLLKAELEALMEGGFDMALTGFNDAELADLLADEDASFDPHSEWEGMPEFENADLTAFQTLTLHLKDEEAVRQFEQITGIPITPKTRYAHFPHQQQETFADKAYVTEGDEAA